MAGPNQPIHFPVPWASDPSFSFLLPPDETRSLILGSGFRELVWMTGATLEAEVARPDEAASPTSSRAMLDPGLLNGADAPRVGATVARNRDEGRIVPALGVFERI